MKKSKLFLIPFMALVLAFSPVKDMLWNNPKGWPAPHYDFSKNPLSSAKIELGRALFYDPILSLDNTISCATCHSPYNAFAHTDHALSHGIHDSIGSRNAPALFNAAWQKSFMWDGAIQHLDMQALAPMSHPAEMGEDIAHVVIKLQSSTIYPSLFNRAFSDSVITGEHLLKAISQFQLTLVSNGSKYDNVKSGGEDFTDQENKGYALFLKNCNSCHAEPLFSTFEFTNNGLELDSTLNDLGKYAITHNVSDSMKFKIPSLRNLSFTFPYMHDGRFKKLSQVINHYVSKKNESSTLAEQLRSPIQLTANDKADLISFLLTLDDKSFVFDAKHQFPKEILLGAKE